MVNWRGKPELIARRMRPPWAVTCVVGERLRRGRQAEEEQGIDFGLAAGRTPPPPRVFTILTTCAPPLNSRAAALILSPDPNAVQDFTSAMKVSFEDVGDGRRRRRKRQQRSHSVFPSKFERRDL